MSNTLNKSGVLVVLRPILFVLLLIGIVVTARIPILDVSAAQVLAGRLELRVLLDQPLIFAFFFFGLVQRRRLERTVCSDPDGTII